MIIPIETVLAFPTICSVGEHFSATEGVEFSWSPLHVSNQALAPRASTFYANLCRCTFSGSLAFMRDDEGTYAALVAPGIAVGSIPGGMVNSPGPLRKRLKRYGKKADLIRSALEAATSTRVMQSAMVHAVPNINSRILGACEAYQNGDRSPKHLNTIKKSCFQLRAIVQSSEVLLPSWKPDIAENNPLNKIHHVARMQLDLWQVELDARNIRIELGTCHDQVHMEANLLASVFTNMLSNIAKYADRNSTVTIGFENDEGDLVVRFDMLSATIQESELDVIRLVGGRSREAVRKSKAGQGLGLAFIDRVMRAYGGTLEIFPGSPLARNRSIAPNMFTLRFSSRWVRRG